jgi:formylglycine-generating enzyme required for sulfatase activity
VIAFNCQSCQKKLTVQDSLGGKKVKCGGCGQVVVVPAPTAARVAGSPVDPPARQEEPTVAAHAAPAPAARADQATNPPPSLSDPTRSPDAGQPEHEAGLTSFLAPRQADDELGRLGGFRILKILGHGGMGVVFQGEDPKLGRKVAIKAMLPHLAGSKSSQERFLREARTAAALEHDHIVPILQVGEDRGAPYIVMPFLKGEPLDARLQREKKLPLAEVLRLGAEIAEGLAAAHEQGLIHRDIKPGNIWLEASPGRKSGEYRIKILDFGLARATSGEHHLTQTGAVIGTPAYMAPEQAQSQNIDGRADLFSLGVVLYRLSTGAMPFRGHDTMSTLLSLAMDNPKPPRELNADVPEELSNLVMKLLEKKPAERIGSASEVVQALQVIANRLAPATMVPVPATTPLPPAAARPRSPLEVSRTIETPAGARSASKGAANRKPLVLALAVGLVAAVVLGLVFFWPRPDDSAGKGGAIVDPPTKVKEPPKDFTNSIGMKLVRIPAGKFIMGSSPQQIQYYLEVWKDRLKIHPPLRGLSESEGPEHEVEITRPFDLGVHEVTVGQFRRFVTEKVYNVGDARWEKPGFEQGDEQPVVFVSWYDAVAFCKWLSDKEGKKYRLPTEAEWEYCCRAGRNGTRYSFGDDEKELRQHAWYFGNSEKKTHPVGKLKSNAWGLFDMHGNAWEWCQDGYDPNYYKTSPKQDPQGGAGVHKVFRGGSYNDVQFVDYRTTVRSHEPSTTRRPYIGFRVVCEIPAPTTGKKGPTYALRFDGTDTVQLPAMDLPLSGPLTLETYVDVAKVPQPGGCHFIDLPWFAAIGGPDSVLGSLWFNVPQDSVGIANNALKPGMNHVAGVWAPGELSLYLNGQLVASKPASPKPAAAKGARTLGLQMIGTMREVRISKSARYSGKSFTPQERFEPDADTLALYHFDEGEGNTLKDSSGHNHHGEIKGAKWVKLESPPTTGYRNSIGMEFVLVAKGKSWLGGGGGKAGEIAIEVKNDFYFGKYPVTQEDFRQILGGSPSHWARTGPFFRQVQDVPDEVLKRFPAEALQMEYHVQPFIAKLNAKEKDTGWVYRLPTVDEWEYACRGGPMPDSSRSKFDYYLKEATNTLLPEQANVKEKGLNRPCPVDLHSPNSLGVYDMHGNVLQLCTGGPKGALVLRGGCFRNPIGTNKASSNPTAAPVACSIRLVRVPVGKELLVRLPVRK